MKLTFHNVFFSRYHGQFVLAFFMNTIVPSLLLKASGLTSGQNRKIMYKEK